MNADASEAGSRECQEPVSGARLWGEGGGFQLRPGGDGQIKRGLHGLATSPRTHEGEAEEEEGGGGGGRTGKGGLPCPLITPFEAAFDLQGSAHACKEHSGALTESWVEVVVVVVVVEGRFLSGWRKLP